MAYICLILAKLPLSPKTELCIKYSTLHRRRNTQVCLHDCSDGGGAWKGFTHKTCSGPSGLVDAVKVTRVTHQGRKKNHGDRAVTHKERTPSSVRVMPLHFFHRMSLFDTPEGVCACLQGTIFSMNSRRHKGSNCSSPMTVCRRGCQGCGRCTQTGKVKGKRSLIRQDDLVNDAAPTQQAKTKWGCVSQQRDKSQTARLLRLVFDLRGYPSKEEREAPQCVSHRLWNYSGFIQKQWHLVAVNENSG